jgi:hypothetical protein
MLFSSVLTGSLLRVLILFRGYRSGILGTYSWFYTYIASSLLADVLINLARVDYVGVYKPVYWACQFATLAIGCGLILEIFRHVLEPYPGAERFARAVCLVTFGVIFLVGFLFPRSSPLDLQAASIELERDVRSAQIVFFVAILAVISHYAIPLGRNMRGMMLGYGIYLLVSLATLSFRAYIGMDFDRIWRVIQPLSFNLSLLIWLIALWSLKENPKPKREVRIETDYEALAALTRDRLRALRAHLGRSTR